MALTLATLSVKPSMADTRRALVIGIDDYENVADLEKAVNDAKAISERLETSGFETDLILDADGSTLITSLERIASRIQPGDEVVFYFAGHGVEVDGQNYLLPADIQISTGSGELALRRQSLPVSEVTNALQRKGARVSLLILDACRDNPFDRTGTRSLGGKRGLARIDAPEGTYIMYSAGAGQAALDTLGPNDANPNSVFTRALLPRLAMPGMRLRDMVLEVRSEVRDLAGTVGHNQFPAVYDQLDGTFQLTRAARKPHTHEVFDGATVPPTSAQVGGSIILNPSSEATGMQAPPKPQLSLTTEELTALQSDLVALGLLQPPATGQLNQRTKSALSAFQKAYSLPETGTPDVATRVGIQAAARYAASPRPMAETDVEASLRLTAPARREIQRRLYLTGFDPRGIDGAFGPRTRSAISRWQGEAGFEVSGYLNALQVAALKNASQADYAAWKKTQAARPTPKSFSPSPSALRSTSRGRYFDERDCLREPDGSIVMGYYPAKGC